jgi:phosphoserine phosphatase
VRLALDRDRLRFRDTLRRASGFEVFLWPDGSRGRTETVVVAPYEFWAEALLIARDGIRLRLPVSEVREIDPVARLLLASLPPSIGSPVGPCALRPAAFFDLDRTLLRDPEAASALAAAPATRANPVGQPLSERGERPSRRASPLELAAFHRARGQPVYLVSASRQAFAHDLAARLGLDGALSTATLQDTTDRSPGGDTRLPLGAAKADAVRMLANRERLDLAASTAYADSVADLPLLELVGHPVALNPDRRLRQAARDRGWPLLELRPR